MELDITSLVTNQNFNANNYSCNKLRDPNNESWDRAVKDSTPPKLLTDATMVQKVKDYLMGFGAWDQEEINGWSDNCVEALLLQDIAATLKEYSHLPITEWDWDDYEEECALGIVSGRLFKGNDGKIYYYVD